MDINDEISTISDEIVGDAMHRLSKLGVSLAGVNFGVVWFSESGEGCVSATTACIGLPSPEERRNLTLLVRKEIIKELTKAIDDEGG